jgi:hypothetical protein
LTRLYLLASALVGSPAATGAATGTGGLGLDTLIQTGVTGALAAILLVFARTAYARETARADRLEAKLDELNDAVLERYAGALADATRAVADATATLSRVR